jgi:peptidoglycan/xylan/chitin deacetylase (PgdA/CDA1 family)
MSPKILALHVLRAIGGFAIAQYLTRKRLRILCYHGFAIGDEYLFAPFMFMKGSTFANRMNILKRRGVRVVSLEEGVNLLRERNISRAETVITLDDGWASNLTIGLPILKHHGFPACIYITTEHIGASAEVFNVIFNYMVQRSQAQTLELRGVHPEIDGSYPLRTDFAKSFFAIASSVEKNYAYKNRIQVLRAVATALGLDLDEVLKNDRFRLVTPEQIVELHRNGVDIQLHTHTHRLPDKGFEAMAYEIQENRKAIKAILGEDKHHFCYPSGMYSAQHQEWLARLGIQSATTCDTGLNPAGRPPLLLNRFLDREDFSDIEFESEIAGVRELLRMIIRPRQARVSGY